MKLNSRKVQNCRQPETRLIYLREIIYIFANHFEVRSRRYKIAEKSRV